MADYLSLLGKSGKDAHQWESTLRGKFGPEYGITTSGWEPGKPFSVNIPGQGDMAVSEADIGSWQPPGWTESSSQPSSGQIFDVPTLTPDVQSTQTQAGTTSGTTSAGIDWESPGVSGLLDQIKKWTGRASGMAENVIPNINNFYGNMMRNALGPQAFQGTLNDLRERNILDSSVASDALAKAGSNIAGQIGGQGLDTYLKAYDTQIQMPGLLASMANLGGKTTTTTGETSGTGAQTNPIDVYRLIFGNYL